MSTASAGAVTHSVLNSWPGDPAPPYVAHPHNTRLLNNIWFYRVGYLSRKALPIKRNDAEPLTREDVQYDLLDYIFSDTKAIFTLPPPAKAPTKVKFSDLYITTLSNSGKCSKVLKDKMIETPAFALELAKISLLTNVGRINTTMACKCSGLLTSSHSHCIRIVAYSTYILVFPEMKTALRTYHPVPSLQKTDGNAQDAPRIKNCLKAALLPSETKNVPPSTPEEILQKNVCTIFSVRRPVLMRELTQSYTLGCPSFVYFTIPVLTEQWSAPANECGQPCVCFSKPCCCECTWFPYADSEFLLLDTLVQPMFWFGLTVCLHTPKIAPRQRTLRRRSQFSRSLLTEKFSIWWSRQGILMAHVPLSRRFQRTQPLRWRLLEDESRESTLVASVKWRTNEARECWHRGRTCLGEEDVRTKERIFTEAGVDSGIWKESQSADTPLCSR